MNTSEWIAISGIAASILITTIGSTLLLTYKIGGITEKIVSMEKILTKVVQDEIPSLKFSVEGIRIELAEMQVKLDVLWRHHLSMSNSPVTLNDTGSKILATSNIGVFASDNYAGILSKVKVLKPENEYQAKELLISVMARFKKDDRYRFHLQREAYLTGHDVDSLLFVAALSIRDRVIEDLAPDLVAG